MNDKLYIIGNGFDLHHNMRTSYVNFRDDFARKKQYLWKTLSSLYGDRIENNMWWCSFEEMLARIDYVSLMSSHNGLALGSTKSKAFLTNNLPVFFGEWIKTVDEAVKPDMCLEIDKGAQFFTFNYTMLLERAYGIDGQQVWHIHNSLLDNRSGINLIVGHDSDERRVFSHMRDYERGRSIQRKDIADDINQMIAKGAKKVNDRIASNADMFYQRYSSIKHYISMGFSFNDIDKPYIEKIVSVNDSFSDADWILYSHSDVESEHLGRIMQEIGVDSKKMKIIRW